MLRILGGSTVGNEIARLRSRPRMERGLGRESHIELGRCRSATGKQRGVSISLKRGAKNTERFFGHDGIAVVPFGQRDRTSSGNIAAIIPSFPLFRFRRGMRVRQRCLGLSTANDRR